MHIVRESMAGILHVSGHDHAEDKTPDEVRESAYRRGFHQALYLVTEGVASDLAKPGQLRRWLDEVFSWRFRYGKHRRSRSVVTSPPDPPWEVRTRRPLACQSPDSDDVALYVKPGCWCATCSAGGHRVKVVFVCDDKPHALIEWDGKQEYVHLVTLRDPARTTRT